MIKDKNKPWMSSVLCFTLLYGNCGFNFLSVPGKGKF